MGLTPVDELKSVEIKGRNQVTMMLVAIDEKKQHISLWNKRKEEIQQLKGLKFYCPVCYNQVILKSGSYKRAHFAHKSLNCSISSEGETAEHLEGKKLLIENLVRYGKTCELERYFPKSNQRADVFVSSLALEFQCSPLDENSYQKRTLDYQLKEQVTPIWLLGSRYFPANRKKWRNGEKRFFLFSKGLGSYYWILDTTKQQLGLVYHIEETFLTSHYQVKWWYLKKYSVYEIVTQVEQLKVTSCYHYRVRDELNSCYRYLSQSLNKKQVKVLKIQEYCYLKQGNLLNLPIICYLPIVRIPGEIGLIYYLRWLFLTTLQERKQVDMLESLHFLSLEYQKQTLFSLATNKQFIDEFGEYLTFLIDIQVIRQMNNRILFNAERYQYLLNKQVNDLLKEQLINKIQSSDLQRPNPLASMLL